MFDIISGYDSSLNSTAISETSVVMGYTPKQAWRQIAKSAPANKPTKGRHKQDAAPQVQSLTLENGLPRCEDVLEQAHFWLETETSIRNFKTMNESRSPHRHVKQVTSVRRVELSPVWCVVNAVQRRRS